ncbi:hypothetical protein D0862_14867, partial [Hortaea werneckii]
NCSSTPLCGICTARESKYKCPVCALRYCSLACYKRHQPMHATASSEGATPTTQPQPTAPSDRQPKDRRPGTSHRIPNKIDPTHFDTDPDFQALLHRYPRLRIQLQALYALTLEPGPEEARSWSREPLPGDSVPTATGSGSGWKARGRGGGRGRRGGRGSGTGGDRSAEGAGGRQHGVWTVEKGEKEALGVMRKMRTSSGNQQQHHHHAKTSSGGGGRSDDKAEGLREFIELCMLRFGKAEREGGMEERRGEGRVG